MTTESVDNEPEQVHQGVESERGALVAVLVMVVLGLAGIFAVSA